MGRTVIPLPLKRSASTQLPESQAACVRIRRSGVTGQQQRAVGENCKRFGPLIGTRYRIGVPPAKRASVRESCDYNVFGVGSWIHAIADREDISVRRHSDAGELG